MTTQELPGLEYMIDPEGAVWLTYPKYEWKSKDLVFVPEWKREEECVIKS